MNIKKDNSENIIIGKILLGWVLAGPIIGLTILLHGGFMAGAATLIILMAIIMMIFGAPIHMFLAKKYRVTNFTGHIKIVIGIVVTLFCIFLLLGVSGMFNFV